MNQTILKFTLCLIILNAAFIFSQNNVQGEQSQIKESILKSNNITTVIFNYGSIGKPNYKSNIADLVWDSLGYMFEFGPIAAAEVVDSTGDTLHITDDSFILPTQGNYNPDGTQKWGWLPDSGYSNPNLGYVATKNNPSSWPVNWESWSEFPGDSLLKPFDEAYYVMDDYSNAKFPYYPFPSDTNKRGLGLKAEVRIYQFGQSFKDALIIRYKITNESPKDLSKIYFGFQGDPHIGGATDYSDDLVHLYLNNNLNDINSAADKTIYLWDNDGRGMGGIPTGYLGFKFLETPDNFGLTSFHPAQYTNSLPNVPKNSALMWEWLSGGFDTTNYLYNNPGDNIINFGTGPFSLKSGETKYLTLAIFLSHDYNSMIQNAVNIYLNQYWPNITSNTGDESGNNNYKIKLASPISGEVNGNTSVSWNYSGSDVNAKTVIEYSSNMGRDWYVLASGLNASDGSYKWNTINYKDGVNYILRIIAYNAADEHQNYYSVGSGRFTINNPGDAQPELQITNNLKDTTITESSIPISWTAEDADNQNLNITLSYSLNPESNFTNITAGSYQTGSNSFIWDLHNVPNADQYYIKVNSSDGTKDSSVILGPFKLDYALRSYVTTNVLHESGNATPDFYIQVVDNDKITKDTYRVKFNADNPDAKTMDVIDYSAGKIILSNYPLTKGLSTPAFDGIKLTVNDRATGINYDKTGFNNSALESAYTILFPPELGNSKTAVPNDWDLVFNNLDTNSSGMYLNPADTISTNISGVNIIVPYYLYNRTYNDKGEALLFVSSGTQNLTAWKPTEKLILRPQNPTGAITSYQINFNFNSGVMPGSGDTLHIVTYKTITSEDVFRFAVDSSSIITGVEKNNIPGDFNLDQNYPNPFNPTTTISFVINHQSFVTLKVYDVLGNEAATLVNEEKPAGKYNVVFNAGNLASGVYYYQLKSGNFIETRKMIYLK